MSNKSNNRSEYSSLFSPSELTALGVQPSRSLGSLNPTPTLVKQHLTTSNQQNNGTNHNLPRSSNTSPRTSKKELDFDDILSSGTTVKLTSTPERLKSIEVKRINQIKLEPKSAVISKFDDTDDDDMDFLGSKREKPRENYWEFLRNTGPDDDSKPFQKSLPTTPSSSSGIRNASLTNLSKPISTSMNSLRANSNPSLKTIPKNDIDTLPSDDEDALLFGLGKMKKVESLADFLRNSGPPEPEPTPVVETKKKKGGFSKFFKSKNDLNSSPTSSTGSIGGKPVDPTPKKRHQMINAPSEIAKDQLSFQKPRTSTFSKSSSQGNSNTNDRTPHESGIAPDQNSATSLASKKSIRNPTDPTPPTTVRTIILPPRKPVAKSKTIVPSKLDQHSPISQVLDSLVKLDGEFSKVFQARGDLSSIKPLKTNTTPPPTKPPIIVPELPALQAEVVTKRHVHVQVVPEYHDFGVQTDEVTRETECADCVENEKRVVGEFVEAFVENLTNSAVDIADGVVDDDSEVIQDSEEVSSVTKEDSKEVTSMTIDDNETSVSDKAEPVNEKSPSIKKSPSISREPLSNIESIETKPTTVETELQTDPIRIHSQVDIARDLALTQLTTQQTALLVEISTLKAELAHERKSRTQIHAEKETYHLRFEMLARMSFDKLVDGLETKKGLEERLWGLDQQFGNVYSNLGKN